MPQFQRQNRALRYLAGGAYWLCRENLQGSDTHREDQPGIIGFSQSRARLSLGLGHRNHLFLAFGVNVSFSYPPQGMKTKSSPAVSVHPRFRVARGADIALGPGKVDLLRLVRDTHSISEAARQMEMSYMRAWSLIQTMNRCFVEPVISTTRGGRERGGASLTETGVRLLGLYEKLEAECLAATAGTQQEIISLLRGPKIQNSKSNIQKKSKIHTS
jgi:molybdate transport system regulatory protein